MYALSASAASHETSKGLNQIVPCGTHSDERTHTRAPGAHDVLDDERMHVADVAEHDAARRLFDDLDHLDASAGCGVDDGQDGARYVFTGHGAGVSSMLIPISGTTRS